MGGRILIVDDVTTNRIILKVKLAAARYEPLLAGDGATALRMAVQERPDLVILGMMLPDMDGTRVLDQLRSLPATRDIPVIVISGEDGEEARLAAFRAGADAFLTRPVDQPELLARLRSLLRARAMITDSLPPEAALTLAEPAAGFTAPGLIALVCNSPPSCRGLRDGLQPLLRDHVTTLAAEDALTPGARDGSAPQAIPDAYVLDADLGGSGGGLQMLSDLLSRSSGRHAAICIRRPAGRGDLDAIALDLGAGDIFSADCPLAEMAVRLQAALRRKAAADRLRTSVQDGLRMAVTDPLTGLHNRRYAEARLMAMVEGQSRQDTDVLAVLALDIDRFKRVNDGWGHPSGDAVLVELARRLSSSLEHTGLLARTGGDEFLIAFPITCGDAARNVAKDLCHVVASRPFDLPGGEALTLTLSIGLMIHADAAAGPATPAALIARADEALLRAKADGGNRVITAGPCPAVPNPDRHGATCFRHLAIRPARARAG